MFKEDSLTIDSDDLVQLVTNVVFGDVDASFDELLTDLRTCSFLTVDADGGLQFIHRSYQEFFLAHLLRRELQEGSTGRLGNPLRWEYTYFLGAFAFTNNDFYNLLLELARGSESRRPGRRTTRAATVGDNAAQALLAARDSASSLAWVGRTVNKVKKPRLAITRSTLTDVVIDELSTEHCELSDSRLRLVLGGAPISHLSTTRCTGTIELRGRVDAVALTGGTLSVNDSSSARRLTADNMDLRLAAAKEGSMTLGLIAVEGGLRFDNVEDVDVTFSGCRLAIEAPESVVRGTIEQSGVELSLSEFDNLTAQLSDCVVIVKGGRLSPRDVGSLGRRPPRVRTRVAAFSEGTVLLLDPSVSLDAWWSGQPDMLTFGGSSAEPHPNWRGLIVNVRSLRRRKDQDSFVQIRRSAQHAFILEGRGGALKEAGRYIREVVESASFATVCEPRWLSERMASLVERLEIVDGSRDELLDVLALADRRLEALRSRWQPDSQARQPSTNLATD